MIRNVFGETTSDVFCSLVGYTVGDTEQTEGVMIIRFDKQVENVIISRRIMFDGDMNISVTDDYVLDILPNESITSERLQRIEEREPNET